MFFLQDVDRLTKRVSVKAFSRWSTGLPVERTGTSRRIGVCARLEAPRLMSHQARWPPEPRCTIHRQRRVYGNQDEWEESRLHGRWRGRALFAPNSTNVQVGVWAATEGGESPTGLFRQRVNELVDSFTKMTQRLPFPGIRVFWNACRLHWWSIWTILTVWEECKPLKTSKIKIKLENSKGSRRERTKNQLNPCIWSRGRR